MTTKLTHPHLLHPKTGLPLEAVGVLPSGRVLWPVLGAAPDDPDDGGQSDADADGDDEDTAEEAGDGGEATKDKKVDRADLDKMKEQLRAADKKRVAAEKRAKELEDKDKDELTKAQEATKELEQARTALQTENGQLRTEVAFLKANDVTWLKPGQALKLARADGVFDDVTDEDGVVDDAKLRKALKKFAEENPNLVKVEDGTPPKEPAGKTGAKVGSGPKTGAPTGLTDQALRDRYRVLRN